jgi:hypothetical protein
MGLSFDIRVLWASGCLLLGVMAFDAAAQSRLSPPPAPRQATLSDITEKFVRNMKLMREMTPEEEVRNQITVVVEQAEDLMRLARAKGADGKREQLLKERTEIQSKPRMSARDFERIRELEAEIKKLDPDSVFTTGRNQLQASIRQLETILGQLYITDTDREDLDRIMKRHLQMYQTALSRSPR